MTDYGDDNVRGMIKVQVNEWLVVGPSGEFYARTDEAFWKAHEEI